MQHSLSVAQMPCPSTHGNHQRTCSMLGGSVVEARAEKLIARTVVLTSPVSRCLLLGRKLCVV